MQSLAEFKRRVQIGVKLHTIFHRERVKGTFDEKGNALYTDKDLGIREISKVQSNSFALKTLRSDGAQVDSWCVYPKRDYVFFYADNPDKITILEAQRDGQIIPILTYTFINS